MPYIGETKISLVHLTVRKCARRVQAVWKHVWAGGGAIARVGGTDLVSGSSLCSSCALTRSCPAQHRANFFYSGLNFLGFLFQERAGQKHKALESCVGIRRVIYVYKSIEYIIKQVFKLYTFIPARELFKGCSDFVTMLWSSSQTLRMLRLFTGSTGFFKSRFLGSSC